MKIVMTMMVRDEADIVGTMLEHHRSAGVAHVLITDNGSIDGTREILREFEQSGFATVWDDPQHHKQQFKVVTRMARHAAMELTADWVINADADEFWVPTAEGATLESALAQFSHETDVLQVPVVNLTGAPARDGAGLDRLVYRDHRTETELHAAGIPFHPTSDAMHRGHPAVEVSQGNHFVSAPGWREPVFASSIEVLHLPWRSWAQYERKVRSTGEAYRSNPTLAPSPRHHGMQDFRRWEGGRLEEVYVSKHPLDEEIEPMLASGSLRRDERLARLAAGRPDVHYDEVARRSLAGTGRKIAAVEAEYEVQLQALRDQVGEIDAARLAAVGATEAIARERDALARHSSELAAALAAEQGRLAVRVANAAKRASHRIVGRS